MLFTERQKQLLSRLADGEFHSGSELAELLAVSRTTVWKQLQFFADLGIEIIAVSGKGYRLNKPLDLLTIDKINAFIPRQLQESIAHICLFDAIDSTNTYLMSLARTNTASGTICLAEYQSQGKGRRGRNWVSPFGSNIYLSVLWRFNQGLSVISGLSLVVGIAVIRALNQLGYEDVGLKWPNDIFWHDKKLGGILVEATGESSGPCTVVIGLGINVYLPLSSAQDIKQAWVDLQQLDGAKTLDRNAFAGSLIASIIAILLSFEQTTLAEFTSEWRDYDCMVGKKVQFLLHNVEISGVVQGINNEGLLLMRLDDGSIQAFASGEISFNTSA